MSAPIGRVVATELKPVHATSVLLLDRAGVAVGIGDDRARRCHRGAVGLRRRDRRLGLLRSRIRRCTPSSVPREIPPPRQEPTRARRDPALSPPPCCARCPKSRCSRCRWAGASRQRRRRRASRSGWTPTPRGERPTGIPVGVYAAGGLEAPVYVDADFLLGPEAAHLNITGVSGLATKTSAVEFLLTSIFQHFPGPQGRDRRGLLQREGSRPLLPRPAGALGDEDRRALRPARSHARAVRERCATSRRYKADGVNLNTLRTHEALAAQHRAADLGPPRGARLRRGAAQPGRRRRQGRRLHRFPRRARRRAGIRRRQLRGKPFQVRSFADLEEFFRAIFDFMEELGRGGEVWRTHHIATIRKIRNRLGNISTRSKGLVTDDGAVNDLPWGTFEDRAVLRGRRGRAGSAGAGPGLRPVVSQAAGAPRAPRSGCRPCRGVRG